MTPNPVVMLPGDGWIVVRVYAPHPCGGRYEIERWVYGPQGRVGRWIG